jgi:hypothetical protein
MKKDNEELKNMTENLQQMIIDAEVITRDLNKNIIDEYSFVVTDNKFKETIQPQLDIYNKKFGKQITYESMFENLNALVSLNRIEKNELTSIFSDHISSSSFLIEYKAVMTMLSYFDKFLNSVSNNEQVVAEEFSAGILNSILNFIPKISKLREQYSVSNLDQLINSKVTTNEENILINKERQELKNEIVGGLK